MMNRIFVMSIVVALFLNIPQPSTVSGEESKKGGTLTLAIRKDATVLNPLVRTISTDKEIRKLMFEPLLGLDLRGIIQPRLAESWEISKDGKTYTFNLRRGVRFHNGREMTAQDVKFAIDYSLNPKNSAYGLSRLSQIERVEAAEKHVLKVYLKEPSPSFLSSLTDIRSFAVIPEGSIGAGVTKPTEYPPGTGPFKFVQWKAKQRIIFDRFNDYWGQKALVDRVILRPIRNASVRITALRAGDVDMVERTPYEWVKQIVDGKLKGLSYKRSAHAGFRHITFNVAKPPFNNKKLRQAVAHALNKKEIFQAAFFGFGEQTDQKYPKGHVWYMEGVPSPSYDLKKAKALLKESGYKGETIEYSTPKGEDTEAAAVAIQSQLKKIGVKVSIKIFGYGAHQDRSRRGANTMTFSGSGFYPDPSIAYGAELMCEKNLNKRAANFSGYCDKEMDKLLTMADTETDVAKRKELFRKIVTKMNDDVPYVPVGFVPRFFTLGSHVKGFTTDAEGGFRWWGGGLNYTWLDRK
ncbi:MAG: ABC transporter substrate-binding protein [Nitrospirales bacterium]